MTAIGLVGALSVTCALLCGSTAAAAAAPAIKAIATDASGVWLATSAGLFHPRDSAPTDWQHWQHWQRAKIDGRLDRPIDAVEAFRFVKGEDNEMLTVASEGVLWGRVAPQTWVKLGCNGDDDCPREIRGLTVVNGPKTPYLVGFGQGGAWILRRGGGLGTPPSQLKAWRWRRLPIGARVVAVAQDNKRGRIWAMRFNNKGKPELRIYRFDTGTTTSRDLPRGWFPPGGAAGNSFMTPDTTGGMWLGGDKGVLWMGVDARVHAEFHRRPSAGALPSGNRLTLPGHGPFTVLSVDNSSDDILVGSSAGVARLSLGRSGGPTISSDLPVEKHHRVVKVPVTMAPDVSESETWVATPHGLIRISLDTWSRVPVTGDQGPSPEVTAMTAGGKGNARVVVSLVPGGLEVADWDKKDGRLENWRPPSPPTGTNPKLFQVTLRLSNVLRDGSAFVAPSKGLYRLSKDGNKADEVPAPNIEQTRVSAVEVVSDRLYVGTPRGLFSAPYDYRRAKLPAKLEPVKGFETADVTAIWGCRCAAGCTSGPGSARAARTWETGRPCRRSAARSASGAGTRRGKTRSCGRVPAPGSARSWS